jgi:hypothetical protein
MKNELVDIIKGVAAKISHKMGYNGKEANSLDQRDSAAINE